MFVSLPLSPSIVVSRPAAAGPFLAAHGVAVLGWVATLLTVVAAVPQAVRHWRRGDGSGSTLTVVALQLISAGWWASYEAAIGAWPAMASSLGWMACLAVSAVVLARTVAPASRRRFVAAVAAVSLAAVPVAWWAAPVLGVAANLLAWYRTAPTVRALWRDRHTGLAGVSPAGWLLNGGQAVLWIAYALAVRSPLMLAGSLVPLLLSVWVLVLLHRIRQVGPEPAVLAEPFGMAIGRVAAVPTRTAEPLAA